MLCMMHSADFTHWETAEALMPGEMLLEYSNSSSGRRLVQRRKKRVTTSYSRVSMVSMLSDKNNSGREGAHTGHQQVCSDKADKTSVSVRHCWDSPLSTRLSQKAAE